MPGWYTWSNMPPSAKWTFWAWAQLPATWSSVNNLMLGNCAAYLRENFSTEPYGIGLNRDDTALRNKINDILEEAATDGTWKQIYDATLGKSGSPADPPPLQRY